MGRDLKAFRSFSSRMPCQSFRTKENLSLPRSYCGCGSDSQELDLSKWCRRTSAETTRNNETKQSKENKLGLYLKQKQYIARRSEAKKDFLTIIGKNVPNTSPSWGAKPNRTKAPPARNSPHHRGETLRCGCCFGWSSAPRLGILAIQKSQQQQTKGFLRSLKQLQNPKFGALKQPFFTFGGYKL